ncbi:hypothetical protein T492DRAFT_1015711 [Pavlovales sp. CCMP2436]|nr:hypothetical protein T492DRAFT_1015711 [Pavlovales sp. CCMP2436]
MYAPCLHHICIIVLSRLSHPPYAHPRLHTHTLRHEAQANRIATLRPIINLYSNSPATFLRFSTSAVIYFPSN